MQLKASTVLANRRGVRSISIDDLIFLIRHDKPKVSRLLTFLSWKDVRKTAKDSDDKPGGGGDDLPEDAFAGASSNQPGGAANPADVAAKGMNKHKKAKVKLPWDVGSFYNVQVPEREDDEGDEEEEEMNTATLLRLKNADERTRDMTRLEYVHYSECRQASFTFRKGKRFREWAGFGVVMDSKPNDDIVDILGFLTFEIVQTLTEEALRIKAAEDLWLKVHGADVAGEDKGGDGAEGARKRKRDIMGLFDPPEQERTPVQPKHIQEAFRRLQAPTRKTKAFGNFSRLGARQPLKLI